MKKGWLLSCLFATSIILTFPAMADANQYEKAIVQTPIVDIKLSADENSTVISKISKGQEILVIRKDTNVRVSIFKNKIDGTYSFINLTKLHVCTCKFNTVADALIDLEQQVWNDSKVVSWSFIKK